MRGYRPKIIVVNRAVVQRKAKVDIALISLALSIATSLAGAGWAYFNFRDNSQHYALQTQAQWQQEVSTLIKEVYNSENAPDSNLKAFRRNLLIQQIETAFNEGALKHFSQPPEILSILGFTYANAGYVEKAAGYWQRVADSNETPLPIRWPAALALYRYALYSRSNLTSIKSGEERLDRLLNVIVEHDQMAAINGFIDWADLEINFRSFDRATAILNRASNINIVTPCVRARKETRAHISFAACQIESKEKKSAASILKTLYQISPDDKNWCPGDDNVTDSELSCEHIQDLDHPSWAEPSRPRPPLDQP
jgi:tetratricopeptide (TPR) repeat protein